MLNLPEIHGRTQSINYDIINQQLKLNGTGEANRYPWLIITKNAVYVENGTPSASKIVNLASDTVIAKGIISNTVQVLSGNSNRTLNMELYDENGQKIYNYTEETQIIAVGIYLGLERTYDNYIVGLQLEEGTATPYEPYREEEYELSLGTMELCKIGDAEDFFFKNTTDNPYYNSELVENGWYKYGAIRRYDTIDSESSIEITSTFYRIRVKYRSQLHDMPSDANVIAATFSRCDVVGTSSEKPQVSVRYNYGWGGIAALYNAASRQLIGEKTKAELLEWFNNNEILYIVINPTYDYIDYTQITDTTLISQLEEISKFKCYYGVNHIWSETGEIDANLILNYYKSNKLRLDNIEARLELLED